MTGGYAALGGTGAVPAAWLAGCIWPVSTFVPVTLLPATFPSGRIGDAPVLAGASVLGISAVVVGLATAQSIETSPDASVDNPLGMPFSDGLFLSGTAVVLVTSVVAITSLCLRTRHTHGLDRRRFAPVAVAAVVTLPALLAAGLVEAWSPVIQLAVAPLVPAAVTLSILQYRLYDIELVVRRSVVFAGLTVLVVGGYVLVVQAVAGLLHRVPGAFESVLAAGVVALAFAPARSALQRGVGQRVYGDRDDPGRALTDVNELLTAAAEPTRAVELATHRIRTALRVPWVRADAPDGPVAEVGVRPGWATDDLVDGTALVHLGVDQGTLLLAPRSPREPLGARDRALLAPLATMIAAVLASRRLVADLQRSREDAVLGREEERRRVRRDLHDGVGPLLSALSTHADVAALRLDRSPESVPAVLDRIRAISEDAVTGLRRVVEDLQPVSVDELGMADALRQLVVTMATEEVAVEVAGNGGPGLPAAVEVAAYRIAAEAVHNALRHARPTRVEVRVSRERGLVVVVRDDGVGIGPTAGPGVGLASMRRRAEELGGTLAVESFGAGTIVRAALPVRPG